VSRSISIKLRSFDSKLLDKAAKDIVRSVKKVGSGAAGPIPIPRKIEKFTFNSSPHVFKKSREQLEIRTHTRLIVINDPTVEVGPVVGKVEVPVGVDVYVVDSSQASSTNNKTKKTKRK
jgi:small subunit ribosomal protein S10